MMANANNLSAGTSIAYVDRLPGGDGQREPDRASGGLRQGGHPASWPCPEYSQYHSQLADVLDQRQRDRTFHDSISIKRRPEPLDWTKFIAQPRFAALKRERSPDRAGSRQWPGDDQSVR